MDYTLSIEGLADMPFDKYEKNFTFVINGKEKKTNRLIADFLSPIIRRTHNSDGSDDTFCITIKDDKKEASIDDDAILKIFEDFLNLFNFKSHSINSTQKKYYKIFFYELGNITEYFRLQPEYLTDISTDNVIARIREFNEIKNSKMIEFPKENEIYQELIKFASNNFDSLNKEELIQLDDIEIEAIISSSHLKLQNEDCLFNFVERIYKEDSTKSFLLDHVIIRNLSKETLKRFMNELRYDDLDEVIWKSISSIVLSQENMKKEERKGRYKDSGVIRSFEFKSENKFNGILKYLSKETNGNILENGTVGVTATSVCSDYPLKNLVDFNKGSSYFRSGDDVQTITFDFKDKKIQVTDYSIQTGTDGANGGHLKSWAIEVSEDGEKWTEIDHRENDSSLNGDSKSATFSAQNKNSNFYQFVRLRQIGFPWAGKQLRIEMRYIEFFGRLKQPSSK
ncbi:hypothetical protein M9Y10_007651 [Tritrichomonas musculus]|uniref:F5/8 type C domain-containing protein n=1 Tax=Tritrichomonas musculus TaxID=1915356 RepID=A0ABR2J2U3_9EUKA